MKTTIKETPRAGMRTAGQKKPEVGKAMVDALEDILRWERDSERLMRAAAVQPAPSVEMPSLHH